MLFSYTAVAKSGAKNKGTLEAPDKESATSILQRRGLTVIFIMPEEKNSSGLLGGFFKKLTSFIH